MGDLKTISETNLNIKLDDYQARWAKHRADYERLSGADQRALWRPKKLDLKGYDLSGYDLSKKILYKVDFEGSELLETKFCDAYLEDASFNNVNLTGADFTNADLSWTDFIKASLTETVFTGAKLRGATIAFSNLTKTNFTGAVFGGEYHGERYTKTGLTLDHTALSAVFKDITNFKKANFYYEGKPLLGVAAIPETGGLTSDENLNFFEKMCEKFNGVNGKSKTVYMKDILPELRGRAAQNSLPLEPVCHNGTEHLPKNVIRMAGHRPAKQ